MKITNGYQKCIRQITTFPTGDIIEQRRKYLENRLLCITSNFWYLIGILLKEQESE